jgi:signal transduction histidine kinase
MTAMPGQPAAVTLRGPVADAVLAAAVFAAVLVWGGAHFDWLGRALALVCCLALLARRRFPVPVAAFILAVLFGYYPLSSADGPLMLVFVVAIYQAAAESHMVAAAGLALVALIGFLVEKDGSGTPHLDSAAPLLLAGWFVAAVAMGGVMHNRSAYLREAEQRARDLEARQEQDLRLRATQERLRMARELHDVIGHHISLISVQSGAALHGLRSRSGDVTDELTAIKATSGAALQELRATLGLLVQAGEVAPTSPSPSLGRIPELVERARSVGLDVALVIDGTTRPTAPEVELAGFRIVQESLTNVVKHAAATEALVRIRYEESAVTIRVDDNGTGGADANPGSGSGLQGMAERVRTLGGRFSAVARPGAGFQVQVTLPCDRSEQTT